MLEQVRKNHVHFAPFLLIFLSAGGLLTSDIYIVSLPAIQRYFILSESLAQFSITIFFIGTILASVFSGYLSDMDGRRRIVLGLLVLLTTGSICCLINMHCYNLFLLGRLLQGIGAGGVSLIGYAIMQDCLKAHNSVKMIGLLGMVLIFVPSLSPLLGGFILFFSGWQFITVFILLINIGSLITAFLILPETLQNKERQNIKDLKNNITKLLTNKTYLLNVILYPLASIGYWFILTDASFMLKNIYGIPVSIYPYIISSIVLMFAMGIFCSRVLNHKIETGQLIKKGIFICFIGTVFLNAISLPKGIIFFIVGSITYNFGLGLLYAPSTGASLSAVEGIRGLAATFRTFLVMIASAIGALMAQMTNYFFLNTFMFIGLLFISSLLLLVMKHNYEHSAEIISEKKLI